MKFKLEIDCDNAAFGETAERAEAEVALILEELARSVIQGEMRNRIGRTQYHTIRDTNGNSVGAASFTFEPTEDRRE